jgi:hypothetical protein
MRAVRVKVLMFDVDLTQQQQRAVRPSLFFSFFAIARGLRCCVERDAASGAIMGF